MRFIRTSFAWLFCPNYNRDTNDYTIGLKSIDKIVKKYKIGNAKIYHKNVNNYAQKLGKILKIHIGRVCYNSLVLSGFIRSEFAQYHLETSLRSLLRATTASLTLQGESDKRILVSYTYSIV